MWLMLYSEVNILCMLVLLTILIRVLKSTGRQRPQRLFALLIVFLIAFFALDLLWGMVDQRLLDVSVRTNVVINVLYFSLSGFDAFLCFVYSETVQGSGWMADKRRVAFSWIPLILLIVLTVPSQNTKLIFYVTEDSVYSRGSLYWLQLVLAYGYMVFTSLKALIVGLKRENYARRREYVTLASFCVLPLIFGVLQVFFQGVPMLCVGITLGILQVYLNSQEQLISLDPLTQLNNRNQLLKYLSGRMKNHAFGGAGRRLFMLMMDVDAFKRINDQYGHVEGDAALMRVAAVLKQVGAKAGCFLSRYGGDEFILICEVKDAREIDALCAELPLALAQENVRAGAEYPLTLSIGCAEYLSGIQSIPEFIACADQMLYQAKRARRDLPTK